MFFISKFKHILFNIFNIINYFFYFTLQSYNPILTTFDKNNFFYKKNHNLEQRSGLKQLERLKKHPPKKNIKLQQNIGTLFATLIVQNHTFSLRLENSTVTF